MGSAANLEMPHPIYIERAHAGYVWDADGNRYIDTMLGFGAQVMGHAFEPVRAAVEAQLGKGWHYGIHNPHQAPLARLLSEALPSAERVIFCNSGTEATMYAMRVARAFTGKQRVGVFDGFYHGAHDYGLVQADPGSERLQPRARLMGAGIPDGVAAAQLVLPYREAAALDTIRDHADELAMVMVEPVQSSNPHLDDELGDWLRELQSVCNACGVLFMLDEVITGFRIAYGGAQLHWGLTPDLSSLAKAIGGGFPIGAVAGRADIMALFQGLGQDPRAVFSGGTFSGNPVTMLAGAAHIGYLREHRDQVYPRLNAAGDALAARINGFAERHNMALQMLNAGSMFQLYFQAEPIRSSRDIRAANSAAEADFYLHLLAAGVLIPGTRRAFLSAAHSDADLEALASAIETSLDACREDGLL